MTAYSRQTAVPTKVLTRLQRLLLASLVLAGAALHPSTHAAPLTVLVNPGDIGEQTRHSNYQALSAALTEALRESRGGDITTLMSTDATADLSGTRAQTHDFYVAPAHVAASALRNGYVPLAGSPGSVQAVMVSLKDSKLTTLPQTAGTRLGLPLQDSVVTYLVRGELNAANVSLKTHFRAVKNMRYQDALLVCLKIRECDVVGVERAIFERWKAAGEPVASLLQSRPVPGISVVVRQSLASTPAIRNLQPVLLRTLSTAAVGKIGLQSPAAIEKREYEYVSTLGYFTPRQLPGATVVDAAAVKRLVAEGAVYFDTRTEAEFKQAHVPGARWLPYVEKSLKETDYDAKLDQFDATQLPADKAAPLIFACNGAECWKSYKASRAAIQAGHTRVHWFRGGVPEWRASGLALNTRT
jgi:rhodanese-related sulfurtransferase/ABC-type phosphate/phosphonate transport system substrate-binding protein